MNDTEIEKLISSDLEKLYEKGIAENFIINHFKPMRKAFKQLYGCTFPISCKEMKSVLVEA